MERCKASTARAASPRRTCNERRSCRRSSVPMESAGYTTQLPLGPSLSHHAGAPATSAKHHLDQVWSLVGESARDRLVEIVHRIDALARHAHAARQPDEIEVG